jgi:hypothetical protein
MDASKTFVSALRMPCVAVQIQHEEGARRETVTCQECGTWRRCTRTSMASDMMARNTIVRASWSAVLQSDSDN